MDIKNESHPSLELEARKKRAGKIFLRWVAIAWLAIWLVITFYKEIINALSWPSVQDVRLIVDLKQDHWNGYPEMVNKPKSEWKDKTLHVHVVVNRDSSSVINDRNPRAFVLRSNNLRLCYYRNNQFNSAGQPIPHGVVTPVLLEFLLTGIPEKDYIVEVSDQCPALSDKR